MLVQSPRDVRVFAKHIKTPFSLRVVFKSNDAFHHTKEGNGHAWLGELEMAVDFRVRFGPKVIHTRPHGGIRDSGAKWLPSLTYKIFRFFVFIFILPQGIRDAEPSSRAGEKRKGRTPDSPIHLRTHVDHCSTLREIAIKGMTKEGEKWRQSLKSTKANSFEERKQRTSED